MNKIKQEIKQIDWLSKTNVIKQTLFILLVTIISSILIGAFDSAIKMLISLIFQ